MLIKVGATSKNLVNDDAFHLRSDSFRGPRTNLGRVDSGTRLFAYACVAPAVGNRPPLLPLMDAALIAKSAQADSLESETMEHMHVRGLSGRPALQPLMSW